MTLIWMLLKWNRTGRIARYECAAVLIVFQIAISAFGGDFVIVVDTSGSMTKSISNNDRRIRITTVQEALQNYLRALPLDSRVTLISFNSGIASEREVVLRNDADRKGALQWVEQLDEEAAKDGQTHLWTTLRRALQIASAYAKQNPDETIGVRVLTDGQDTERVTTLDKVLAEFPLVNGESIRANLVLLGDIEMDVVSKKGFEITHTPNFTDIFPPVIQWAPSPAKAGQKISFFDNSQSVYRDYEWKIDGKPAGKQKAVACQFDRAGRHTVALHVTGTDGTRLKPVQAVVAVVESDLGADFSISASEIEPQQEVKFFGRATGSPVGYAWLFNGKEVGTALDHAARFEKECECEIKFVVRDAQGQTASRTRTIRVKESALAVAFKTPEEVVSGQNVQFVNETTGRVASWEWDFGDGAKSAERNPSHAFKNDGETPRNFSVTLHATTPTGRAAASQPVAIRVAPEKKAPPPQAAFRVLGDSFKVGVMVQFMDESKGLIESYAWDFGGEGVSPEKNPEFHFTQVGDKTVRLVVKGPGGESSDEKKLSVQPRYQPPRVKSIFASPVKGKAPLQVKFAGEIAGDYKSLVWDFGDGEKSDEPNVSHTFTTPGNCEARLTLQPMDPAHAPAAAVLDVKVNQSAPIWVWPAAAGALALLAIGISFLLHRASIPFVEGALRGQRRVELLDEKARGSLVLPLKDVSDKLSGDICFRMSGKRSTPVAEARIDAFECRVNGKTYKPGEFFALSRQTQILVNGEVIEYKNSNLES